MKAVIFDIDGTLAEKGDRTPFDWSKVDEDEPHLDIIALTRLFRLRGYSVLLVSGRDEVCREQTIAWLKTHDVHWDGLFMRPANNYEKDTVIKQRIYENNIKPMYEVIYVFDDRNQVVELWRSLGLRCLQVALGDF